MNQNAVVKKILPNGNAEIEVVRKAACTSDCSKCKGCDHHPEQKIFIEAHNPIEADVGDLVLVQSSTSNVLKGAAAIYVLPLVMMCAGYFVAGALSEGLRILISMLSLAAGLFICKLVYNSEAKKRSLTFTITHKLR